MKKIAVALVALLPLADSVSMQQRWHRCSKTRLSTRPSARRRRRVE
jgi:hypothetical protein